MPRRLELGETGEIGLTPQRKGADGRWRRVEHAQAAKRWRAHARYRGWDGVVLPVDTFGRTRKEASAACEALIKDRLRTATADIRPTTPLKDACDAYLTWLARPGSPTSARTLYDYRASVKNVINNQGSKIGNLKLAEANDTQRPRTFLQQLADERGTGTATRVKSILSGTMRFAVISGVLDENKVRHVGAVRSTTAHVSARDHSRAMARSERDAVIALAHDLATDPAGNPRTVRKRRTVADQIAFMAGTGVRIDESRILRWTDLSQEMTRAAIRGTKTTNSNRVLSLPAWLAGRLQDRLAIEASTPGYEFDSNGYVFAAPGPLHNRKKWEPSNNSSAVRTVLNQAGLDWAIPHTFRRTVATLLDQEGVPLARIADQLGHDDPAMTMQKYLGRDPRGDKSDVADYL